MNILLMTVLFIPILLSMGSLYEWTHPDFVAAHELVAAKTGYLNVPFFIIRAIIYFGLWILGTLYYVRQGRAQDSGSDPDIRRRLQRNAAPWMVIYVLTMTFAMVDWPMSLTPEWFSGIYPVTIMISQAISGISLIIVTMVMLARRHADLDMLLTSKRLQDLGNFLMAFSIFWAYVNFSQIIILWSNNIVETNTWYVLRFGLEWRAVGIFLLFFGFFGTFLILLSRWVKRKRRALTLVAIWALIVQLVNIFYIVVPSYHQLISEGEEGVMHIAAGKVSGLELWLDLALIVGMGGIWLWFYVRQLSSQALVPVHDPRIEPSLKSKVVSHG